MRMTLPGVNRAECRPPLPSWIAPGVLITAPTQPPVVQTSDVTKNSKKKRDDVSMRLSAKLGQVVTKCWRYRNAPMGPTTTRQYLFRLSLTRPQREDKMHLHLAICFCCLQKRTLIIFKPDLYAPVYARLILNKKLSHPEWCQQVLLGRFEFIGYLGNNPLRSDWIQSGKPLTVWEFVQDH